ncbi:MAG: lipopolysaccharide kinase InaA family protein [Planctomycetota bacterium]|jgi:hypothetical protein
MDRAHVGQGGRRRLKRIGTRYCELHIRDDWRGRLAAAGLDSYSALMRTTAGECVSDHRRGQVWRIALPSGERLYLKRDSVAAFKEALADLLEGRRPRAFTVKERLGIERAAELGIRVPQPVAWGSRRRLFFPGRGVLVMTELAGRPLDDWLASNTDRSSRSEVLQRVGSQVGRLYGAGLSWPDLQPKHVYIDDNASVGLLDLERLRPSGRWARRMREQVRRFTEALRGGADEEEIRTFDGALGSALKSRGET